MTSAQYHKKYYIRRLWRTRMTGGAGPYYLGYGFLPRMRRKQRSHRVTWKLAAFYLGKVTKAASLVERLHGFPIGSIEIEPDNRFEALVPWEQRDRENYNIDALVDEIEQLIQPKKV